MWIRFALINSKERIEGKAGTLREITELVRVLSTLFCCFFLLWSGLCFDNSEELERRIN